MKFYSVTIAQRHTGQMPRLNEAGTRASTAHVLWRATVSADPRWPPCGDDCLQPMETGAALDVLTRAVAVPGRPAWMGGSLATPSPHQLLMA